MLWTKTCIYHEPLAGAVMDDECFTAIIVWLDRLLETITLIGVSVSEPHTSVLNCDFSLSWPTTLRHM